ncbi:Citrate synthase (si) [Euzebya pacifica]|uniref:Citrate synthase n=1 Tax=Euzebya pacifica TaxID=1608957 RepID=A0A346XZS3_9ACTN|nr:citrate synthase [Euzebya pacifica]AXV07720.1 Citrate synthase (si) [Euzebya pacifica]
MTDHARIELEGDHFEAPVVQGTEGDRGIHSSGLRGATGLTTYDPGFASTSSCRSDITYLNGEAGILRYRGYPIEQLAKSSNFLEVSYLLIFGELPTQSELDYFEQQITIHTLLHEDMRQFFDAFPKSAHPMAILSAATAGLSTFYQDHYDPKDERDVEVSIYRLMAKMPTIAAWSYKKSIGQAFIYPWNKLSYPANFLHMMFGVKAEPYEVDPEIAKALDLLYILHADHEQNASTTAVRLVGSTQVNMFAAIASGINALWGPLHGGANQAVLEMLAEIRDADGDTASFVARAKDKNDPFRLMGFGHRVYKNYDPRATIIKETADKVLRKLAPNDPLFEIAQELEEAALSDDYFIEKKLYPNVDFYSGLIYKALGLPTEMFTVMFAIGRLPGWIAQWKEMMSDPDTRIGRPRQIYTGAATREYVEIENR